MLFQNSFISKYLQNIYILCISFVVLFGITFTAYASTLSGYAWSSTIGWADFSGVTYNETTHVLSGYAWSSNIGWIRFANWTDCPGGGNCQPRVNTVTSELEGWVRVCSAISSNLNTCPVGNGLQNPDAGGWDGWISLNCNNTGNCATSNYRWSAATNGDVSGFAWGSDVVGWMTPANLNLGATITPPPVPVATIEIRRVDDSNPWSSVSPYVMADGEELKIRWSSTDATTCVASVSGNAGGFSTGNITTGIDDTLDEPILGTAGTFTVRCNGLGGNSNIAVIEVRNPSQEVDIWSDDTLVPEGSDITIEWDIDGRTPSSCTISGPGVPPAAVTSATGTIPNIPISGESDFTLVCSVDGINPPSTDVETIRVTSVGTEI